MTLRPGTILRGEFGGGEYRVMGPLGDGGQGTVHLVETTDGRRFAVKWYYPGQATPGQRESIRRLVRQGPPPGPAAKRFLWPGDLVGNGRDDRFGYVMPLIDPRRFASLSEVMNGLRPAPGFAAMCEITFQMANSYRRLHLQGLCYRDISRHNLHFDTVGGDVLIGDNDNIGANGDENTQIMGTWEYMAPEVIRAIARPSSDSDLHSLAVLLFELWIWHHPLHGMMEYAVHSWDDAARRQIYGMTPIFIFDPANARNALPAAADYDTARKRWAHCPATLKDLFCKAFTTGLGHPDRRITEGEWQRAAKTVADALAPCPECCAENPAGPDSAPLSCWHCGATVPLAPWLAVKSAGGRQRMLLNGGFRLTPWHVTGDPEAEGAALGELARHPSDPSIWGLRNLGPTGWRAILPDGSRREVTAGRSIPLVAGTEIHMSVGAAVAVVEGPALRPPPTVIPDLPGHAMVSPSTPQ